MVTTVTMIARGSGSNGYEDFLRSSSTAVLCASPERFHENEYKDLQREQGEE